MNNVQFKNSNYLSDSDAYNVEQRHFYKYSTPDIIEDIEKFGFKSLFSYLMDYN